MQLSWEQNDSYGEWEMSNNCIGILTIKLPSAFIKQQKQMWSTFIGITNNLKVCGLEYNLMRRFTAAMFSIW